jgi:hypothetical protein
MILTSTKSEHGEFLQLNSKSLDAVDSVGHPSGNIGARQNIVLFYLVANNTAGHW